MPSAASGLQSLAKRLRELWGGSRVKKRQEMQDMETRIEALQMENQRLRMLLARKEQECLRLRQVVGRMMDRGAPPPLQLPPPQMGAPLSDLAAMASGRYDGIHPAGVQPPTAAHNFPEGLRTMPAQSNTDWALHRAHDHLHVFLFANELHICLWNAICCSPSLLVCLGDWHRQ
jgi:hypothetical protein